MKTVEDYLKKGRAEFEKLRLELGLLERAKMPLKVREYDFDEGGFDLFSEDYSLAEDFKIQKRSEHLSGFNSYDGGYSRDRHETYPQFYFNLRFKSLVKPVYIQHEGFDKDSRIVIRSVTITDGSKDYANMNSRSEKDIDLAKVLDFFNKKGVSASLLKKLERRVREAGEI